MSNWFKVRSRLKKLIHSLLPDVVVTTGEQERYALASIKVPNVKIREYHFNSNFRDYNSKERGAVNRIAAWFEYRFLGHFFDKNYLLTKEDKDTWFKDNNAFDYQYNPCSFDIPENLPVCKRENVAVAVGRLAAQKNFSALLRIWAKVDNRNWTLHIIGDGYEREMLETLAKKLGIADSVKFLGFRKDVQEQLDKSKMLLMTSIYEGFGVNIIEAMSRGVVPVCYRTPYGPADIITDKDNGILVEYMNEEEFAVKLTALMNDEAEMCRLSKNAHTRSLDFRVEKITAEWMEKYRNLCHRR